RPQLLALDLSVRCHDVVAERSDDVVVAGGPPRVRLVTHLVGIEDVSALLSEHRRDDRLAARDAAGEADYDGQLHAPEKTNAPCAAPDSLWATQTRADKRRSLEAALACVFERVADETCGVAMIVGGCR